MKGKVRKGSLIQISGTFNPSAFERKGGNGETGYSLNITVSDWAYVPGTSSINQDNANENEESEGFAQSSNNDNKTSESKNKQFGDILNLDNEDFNF